MKLNLTIAQKLVIGFGIVILVIATNSFLSFRTLTNNQQLNTKISTINSPTIAEFELLAASVNESKNLIRSWVFIDKQNDTKDKLRLKEIFSKNIPEKKNKLLLLSQKWEGINDQDSLKLIFDQIEVLKKQQDGVMSLLNNFAAYDDAMVIFEVEPMVQDGGEIINTSNKIIEDIASIQNKFKVANNTALIEMNEKAASNRWFSLIASFIVIISSAIVAFLIYNSIVKPLLKSVSFAQEIGNGELSATVDINQTDEIGQLADALRNMSEQIKEIVVGIDNDANQLVDSSQQLKDNSLSLSQGSSNQAASAEEVSSSVEEMLANIEQSSENALQTEKISIETASNVSDTNDLSAQAVEAMKQITDKISFITDIAAQTNILALNAAVEAARAGEHGRGFAVVAAEVRKLAERSKVAADEITILVKKGLSVSSKAGGKAELLVPEVQRSTDLIKEIAAASMEQKNGAEQINQATQQFNTITQQNASAADEVAQNADTLAALANSLKESVKYFNV